MDVADWSRDNGAQVQVYEYVGGRNQQFIIVDRGEGYYQLVSRLSGKVVEIPSSSTDNGEWIKLYDNNGTATQQWKLIEPSVYVGIGNVGGVAGVNVSQNGNTIIVNGAKGKNIAVYGVSGRMVQSLTAQSDRLRITLDDIPSGIYIIRIAREVFKIKL